MPHLLSPAIQNSGCLGGWFCSIPKAGKELQSCLRGEAENGLGKIFIHLGCARAPAKFARVKWKHWLEIEMSVSNEDRAGHNPVYRSQECQRAFLKLEGRRVTRQSEIVEAKRFA